MTSHAIYFYDDTLSSFGNYHWQDMGDKGTFAKHEQSDFIDLCEQCVKDGTTHLWIHPSVKLTMGGKWVEELIQEHGFEDFLYTFDDDNTLVSMNNGYKRKGRGRSHRFNIIFLEYCSWDWDELTIPDIFEMIEDLEFNLGVPVGGSSSGVGMRYLKKVTEKRPRWLAKPQTNLSDMPWSEAARPLVWQREPTEQELACKFLYAFDKNSAHGRAAKEEHFGIGEPEYRDADFSSLTWDGIRPGAWHVTVHTPDVVLQLLEEDQQALRFNMLPRAIWKWDEPVWLMTPLVKLVMKLGYTVDFHEAWVFPNHARVFKGWIENLWDLRREREGYQRDAYKQIMNETLGLLRSDKLSSDTYKFRPDWYGTVVAGTRAAMMYNMIGYALKGFRPVMVQIDAIYYLSSEELPNVAVDSILDHQNSLGGYKLKFKIPMDVTINIEGAIVSVRELLRLNLPQSKKLKYLNIVASHLGY